MAQTNDKYALYYPTLSDTPNIPSHFQALAEDVAAELAKIEASIVGQDTNTTYTVSSEAITNGARINLIPSSGTTDFIDIKAGNNNLTITATSDSLITISTDDDSPVYTAGTGLDLATNEFSVNLSELSVSLGTTSVNLGRASGSLTLNGVSIDGSAGSATNLVGTTVNSIPYQSASGTTGYITPSGTNTYLQWTGTTYQWATVSGGGGGGGATSLDGLSDVAITGTPSTGSILRYDGSNFVNTTQTLTLSGNTTIGSSTHTVSFVTSANTSVTLPSSGTLAINPTTTIGDILYASATGTPGTLTRLAGNTATQPAFLTSTGNGTANTTTSFTSSTGTGNVVLATSPSISTSIVTASASFDLLNTTVTTINAFGATTTLAIGGTTASSTHNFASGATISGATKTINIGANGVNGSTTNINIGSATGTTSTVIRGLTATNASLTTPVIASSTAPTADGQIAWSTTYHHFNVGDGTNTMIVPTFRVNEALRSNGTLTSADVNTLVQIDSTSSITVSLPTDSASIPVGSQIHLIRTNTGAVSVQTSNVAATPGHNLRARYSSATLIKLRADNTWLLVGDLSA